MGMSKASDNNLKNEAPTSKLVGIKRNSSEAEYPPSLKLRKGYSPFTPSSDQQVGRYSAKENKKTAYVCVRGTGMIRI